jgi:CheY-like chemotaxis protein
MKALRVLVVEDETIIAMLFAEVLEGMGYEVCAIEATAAGAVATAARCKPDLMIVDANLREGSGVCAVAEILRGGFIPHLFVSGNSLRELSLEKGAIMIQKPFVESDLVRAIQRALSAPKRPNTVVVP